MTNDLDGLLEFAASAAQGAGRVTLEHFGGAAVAFKLDGTEVTEADRAAEVWLRQAITDRYPEDGILGEEGQERPGRSGRRWILDPIDGTRSFASAVPLYAVLVTLEEQGRPLVGCAHFPALSETIVAGRGGGAWVNGQRARVSACDDLSAARLVTSGYEYWRDAASDAQRAGFERLVRQTRFTRTWGDAYGYFLVATGRVDLLCDPICGAYWDFAPMEVIVPEAGGYLAQFDGSPVAAWRSMLATNGRLQEAAGRLLAG